MEIDGPRDSTSIQMEHNPARNVVDTYDNDDEASNRKSVQSNLSQTFLGLPNPLSGLRLRNIVGKEETKRIRLIERGAEHYQSLGSMNISRLGSKTAFYIEDWYHSILSMSTWKISVLWIFSYLTTAILFALMWGLMEPWCGIDVSSEKGTRGTFLNWLFFSVETMATIGYGAPVGFGSEAGENKSQQNIFFGGCGPAFVLLVGQTLVGLMIDALTLGVVFARISRGASRAVTVVFSDKALIQRIGRNTYFTFQVTDMRKHQILEAHIRLYAVRHCQRGNRTAYFQSHTMRIEHPDDELGATLVLALPQVVVHRIDAWSPLRPRPNELEALAAPESCGSQEQNYTNSTTTYQYPDVMQRASDVDSGNREARGKDADDNALELDMTNEELSDFWNCTSLEVIALVEGIDAVSSMNFQARHSYIAEDILFDRSYSPCVSIADNGGAVVDFSKFHHTEELPGRYEASEWLEGSIPSHT